MRARTLEPPRPSIFDSLSEKYSEPPGPEREEPSRLNGSRLVAVAVLLSLGVGVAVFLGGTGGTPPPREVGEISLFQRTAGPSPRRASRPSEPPPQAASQLVAPLSPPVTRPAEIPATPSAAAPIAERAIVETPLAELPAGPALLSAKPAEDAVVQGEAPAFDDAGERLEAAQPDGGVPASPEGLRQAPQEGEAVEPAVKLFAPPPAYPQADWVAAIEGDVSLEAAIDAEGRVVAVEVVQGVSPGLDAAAVQALERWRYRPATRGGEPIRSVQRLTFRFRR